MHLQKSTSENVFSVLPCKEDQTLTSLFGSKLWTKVLVIHNGWSHYLQDTSLSNHMQKIFTLTSPIIIIDHIIMSKCGWTLLW